LFLPHLSQFPRVLHFKERMLMPFFDWRINQYSSTTSGVKQHLKHIDFLKTDPIHLEGALVVVMNQRT
jgi:hypothetical protein